MIKTYLRGGLGLTGGGVRGANLGFADVMQSQIRRLFQSVALLQLNMSLILHFGYVMTIA